MTVEVWEAIVTSGIFSGMLAAGLTLFIQHRSSARKRKLECLRRVAAHRWDLSSPRWLASMNEIFITFNDSPGVMSTVTKFERQIRTGSHGNEHLLDLIKAMMADLDLERSSIDDDFILRPFGAPRPGSSN